MVKMLFVKKSQLCQSKFLFTFLMLCLVVFCSLFVSGDVFDALPPVDRGLNDSENIVYDDNILGGWVSVEGGKNYTAYAVFEELSNGRIGVDISSAQQSVVEDNVRKDIKDARSWKGTDYAPFRLLDDGVSDMEYVDWNGTSVTFKVKVQEDAKLADLSDVLSKDVPIKVDGVQFSSANLKDVADSKEVTLVFTDGVVGHNWSSGFNSTVDTIFADNATFLDSAINCYNGDVNSIDDNYGAVTLNQLVQVNVATNQNVMSIFSVDLAEIIGTGKVIDNFTVSYNFDEVANSLMQVNHFIINSDFDEGTSAVGGADNVSWAYPNDTAVEIWTDGYASSPVGFKAQYMGCLLNQFDYADGGHAGGWNTWYNFELDKDCIQEVYDSRDMVNWGVNLTYDGAGNDFMYIYYSETVTGKAERLHIEYSDAPPTNSVPSWGFMNNHTEGFPNSTAFFFSAGDDWYLSMTDNDWVGNGISLNGAYAEINYSKFGVGGFVDVLTQEGYLNTTIMNDCWANSNNTLTIRYEASFAVGNINVSCYLDNGSFALLEDFTGHATYSFVEDEGVRFNISRLSEDADSQLVFDNNTLNSFFIDADTGSARVDSSFSTNESDVSCYPDNDGLYCNTTNNFFGVVIVTINSSDFSGESAVTSIELLVDDVVDNFEPVVSDISFNNTNGGTSNFLYNQFMDFFSFNGSDVDGNKFGCNLDLVKPSGEFVLSNVSVSNVSDSLYVYDVDVQLSASGNWSVNASCVDSVGVSGSLSSSFVVSVQNVSVKDGWYAYVFDEAGVADLDADYVYGFDLSESNVSQSSVLVNWNSTHLPAVSEAYNLSTRFAFNFVVDNCSVANMEDLRAGLNFTVPDLLGDPYSITVAYLSLDVSGCSDSDSVMVLNNLSESLVDGMNNKFPVYSKSFNGSGLDSSYVKFSPMKYITTSNHEDWVVQEYVTMVSNSSLNRAYGLSGANVSLKEAVKEFQVDVMDRLPSVPVGTLISADNFTVELLNGDVVTFNSKAENRSIGVNVSLDAVDIIGKDVWDSSNKEVPELDTDGDFEVNVSGYFASLVFFEDMSSIRYDGVLGKAFAYRGGSSSTKTHDMLGGNAESVDGNYAVVNADDILWEAFDPHFVKNDFLTVYSQIPTIYINFTDDAEVDDYEVIIVANHSATGYAWEGLNYSATRWYIYSSVADYADTDAWVNTKKAEIDSYWVENNASLSIFLDGIDSGVSGDNFESRFKVLLDYIQVEKGHDDVICNSYTVYEFVAPLCHGGIMKESAVNRWNGADSGNPDNYSREEWSLELNRSRFFHSFGVDVFAQSFDYLKPEANLLMPDNYSEALNIFYATKVLGYEFWGCVQHPNFNQAPYCYVPDVGVDLSNDALTDDDETYYRLYSNGVVSYNITSGIGRFEQGRSVNSVVFCGVFYDPASAGTAHAGINVNTPVDLATGSNSYDYLYDVSVQPDFTWQSGCVSINASEHGRYLIKVMNGQHSSGGINVAWTYGNGVGRHSFYDSTVVNSWTAYELGKNWLFNLTINQSITASFDSLLTINQSVVSDGIISNITLDSGVHHYPLEVWSGLVSFGSTVFKNLTYLGNDNLYYGLSPLNSSLCDSANPDWGAGVTVGGKTLKACYKDSDGVLEVRFATSSLSGVLVQLNGDNTPPVFASIDDMSFDEDFDFRTINLSSNLSDVEDDVSLLSVSYSSNDTGVVTVSSLDNGTKDFTFDSVDNVSGSANISLVLVDSGGLTAFESFDVVVSPVNDAPDVPVLNAPVNLSLVEDLGYVLNWSNSSDLEGDSIVYVVELDDSLLFDSLAFYNGSVAETGNVTGVLPEQTLNGLYYWRVLASDGVDNSSWSDVWALNFSMDGVAPDVYLVSPVNQSVWSSSSVVSFGFFVNDNIGVGSCTVYYDGNFRDLASSVVGVVVNNVTNVVGIALANDFYEWWVSCVDAGGNVNTSGVFGLTVDYVAPIVGVGSGDTSHSSSDAGFDCSLEGSVCGGGCCAGLVCVGDYCLKEGEVVVNVSDVVSVKNVSGVGLVKVDLVVDSIVGLDVPVPVKVVVENEGVSFDPDLVNVVITDFLGRVVGGSNNLSHSGLGLFTGFVVFGSDEVESGGYNIVANAYVGDEVVGDSESVKVVEKVMLWERLWLWLKRVLDWFLGWF